VFTYVCLPLGPLKPEHCYPHCPHTPCLWAPGQPSQGYAAEWFLRPQWGHPEVRRPPGTQCPPPHLIPDLFLSL
jgi:hypothetical protein